MADSLSPDRRSWNMSRIKGKDTSIEVKVRKYLYSKGFRYRKNVKELPGKPDIVLSKYKTVILVHGCFWHRHANCKEATTPKTRIEYWQNKFEINIQNDNNHVQKLQNEGWNVIIIWECEIKKEFEDAMTRVISELQSRGND